MICLRWCDIQQHSQNKNLKKKYSLFQNFVLFCGAERFQLQGFLSYERHGQMKKIIPQLKWREIREPVTNETISNQWKQQYTNSALN